MAQRLEDTTITALVVMGIIAVLVIAAMVFLFTRHRMAANASGASTMCVHVVGPSGHRVMIDVDRLVVGQHVTNARDDLSRRETLLRQEVEKLFPAHFLAFHDPEHHVKVEADLRALLKDGSLMEQTATTPLHAEPRAVRDYICRFDDDSDDDTAVPEHHDPSQGLNPGVGRASTFGLDPPGKRLPLVKPRIYPDQAQTRLMGTNERVTVTAARFVLASDFSQIASIPAEAERLLDQMAGDIAAGKKKIRERSHGDIRVKRVSSEVDGLPPEHGLMVADVKVRGRHTKRVVAVPARLRVCWSAESAWQDYTEPFTLPLGKWCVRAEAANREGETTCTPQTTSRVFTVEQGES